ARFGKAYSSDLTHSLQLKHTVPSHVTFSTVIQKIPEVSLVSAFNDWAGRISDLGAHPWISADGKVLCSTVKDAHGMGQNFEAVVSLFCHRTGLVHKVKNYANKSKDEGEISLVRELVEELGKMGAVITVDALNTQKNNSADSRYWQPLCGASKA
ncbi:MAG: ISAs1 family transposase, partial [Cyanothece sp. SIO2G6]|nr:ISAs1 family transposase [Cyanothece sp. SIO2G6]